MKLLYSKTPIYLLLFLILTWLSLLMINNRVDVPSDDYSPAIYETVYDERGVTHLDALGNVIPEEKLQNKNDFKDDIIKASVVLLALLFYWLTLASLIRKLWLRVLLFILSIPLFVVIGYLISFSLWFKS